ncbi:MAG: hypothetical protein WCQ03_12155, partial [Phycisphaerae bacterium]
MKSQFRIVVCGALVATFSFATTSFAFQSATPSGNVTTWSDSAWDAARRADQAAFDNAILNAPTSDSGSLKALQEAIAVNAAHKADQEKARQESIITRRKEIVDALAQKNLTKAMVAAANLKFLLDNEAWKLELKSDAIVQLQATGQANYQQALKESDWLLAQEMLFRLRALHE